MNEVSPQLLTYKQAGEVLQVSTRTVWNYVNQAKLKEVRFGGQVRIDPRDLEDFIRDGKSSQSEDQPCS